MVSRPVAHDDQQVRLSRTVHRGRDQTPVVSLSGRCKPRSVLVPAGTVLELRIAEELDFLGRRIEAVRGILLSEESLLRRHLNIIAELKEIRAELSELGRLVGTSERLVAASDCIVPTLRLRLLRDVIFPAEGPGEAGEDSAGELQAIDEDADGNPVLRPLRAKLRREI